MVDKYRFYVKCPNCKGTGYSPHAQFPATELSEQVCPICMDDPENPLGPVVLDGLRHIYAGRFEEIEDE